jgi:nicotinamide mononucleotide transporter
MTMHSIFDWLLNGHLTISGHAITYREIVGNLLGLASAIGGMRRKVWAWPVGIVANVLLFTVFMTMGTVFADTQQTYLLGQAGRQIMFIIVSVYGWVQWQRASGVDTAAVNPRWATWTERGFLVLAAAVLVGALTPAFQALGSYPPVWADAWIFTGSLLATYAMARGWVEFWLIWIGVDVVGVPLLLQAKFYPSATMYMVYGMIVIWGFVVWLKVAADQGRTPADPSAEGAPDAAPRVPTP